MQLSMKIIKDWKRITRKVVVKNYLLNTSMTTDEIAFLLAYQETNSFLRAFNTWAGMSAQQYRQAHR